MNDDLAQAAARAWNIRIEIRKLESEPYVRDYTDKIAGLRKELAKLED